MDGTIEISAPAGIRLVSPPVNRTSSLIVTAISAHKWNHKRIYRIYCSLKLNKRRKGKKRLPTRTPAPLQVSTAMNECWSADFTSDALWCGRRFRTFNVVDDFNAGFPVDSSDLFSLGMTRPQ